jgi:hypothetical protein
MPQTLIIPSSSSIHKLSTGLSTGLTTADFSIPAGQPQILLDTPCSPAAAGGVTNAEHSLSIDPLPPYAYPVEIRCPAAVLAFVGHPIERACPPFDPDPALWTRMKLSTWHLLRERQRAAMDLEE